MIERLKIENYKSIRAADLALGRFNVFVGANGSGKSNLLDALAFVAAGVVDGLPNAVRARRGIGGLKWRGAAADAPIGFDIEVGTESYGFSLRVSDEGYRVVSEELDGNDPAVSPMIVRDTTRLTAAFLPNLSVREDALALSAFASVGEFAAIADALNFVATWKLEPSRLRQAQTFELASKLLPDGSNWFSVLHTVLSNDVSRARLVAALRVLLDDVDSIRSVRGERYLSAQLQRGDTWTDVAQESDGTLRVLSLLAVLLLRPPFATLLIEEPELHVHPGALQLVYDHMLEASAHTQLLVTTHSPDFLNLLDLECVRVFVVERQAGETVVATIPETRLEAVKQRLLGLGDLVLSGLATANSAAP